MSKMKTLTINGKTFTVVSPTPIASVTVRSDAWVGDSSPYSQVVPLGGITENSQINLTPTVDQIAIFYEKDITFVTENAGGTLTIYVFGQKPTNDYTIPADIVEVEHAGPKIYGIPIATPINPNKLPSGGTVTDEQIAEAVDKYLEENPVAGTPGKDGQDGEDGKDGTSPVVTITAITGGHRITITDASGTKTVDVLDGADGKDGIDGKTPVKGVDYFDGNPGKDGSPGADGYTPVKGKDYFDGQPGKDGEDGKDGTSVTHSWNGTTLTITSASGTSSTDLKGAKGDKGDSIKGDTGADGVSPTVAVSKSGKVTTVSITDKNGTKTATINDGADGSNGSNGKDGTSVTHSWSGTTLNITSASGTSSANLKGDKGDKGDSIKGDKGDTGAAGTSVTVKSVNESTADGGSNVVTFSDGKTLTVKNGKQGSAGKNGADGKTPVKGVDFWTDADQEAIVQQVITALGTPVFGRVDTNNNIILTGELADGTYTVKYENADGEQTTIGTLSAEDAPTYTNILPLAINSDKTPYNGGQGWKTGYRLNSSGAEATVADWEVTGFIPISTSDTLYFKDIQFRGNSQKHDYIGLYNSSFTSLTSTQVISVFIEQTLKNAGSAPGDYGITLDADNNLVSIDFKKLSTTAYGSVSVTGWQNVKYIRFSCFGITDESIITKNEPIE